MLPRYCDRRLVPYTLGKRRQQQQQQQQQQRGMGTDEVAGPVGFDPQQGYWGEARKRWDNSGGCCLHELHVLLKNEVMIRRLKRDVMEQLPPKRRQVITAVVDQL